MTRKVLFENKKRFLLINLKKNCLDKRVQIQVKLISEAQIKSIALQIILR